MSEKPQDIYWLYKSLASNWKAKKFKAAFEAAQTLTVFIDISCRMHFEKRTGGAGLAGSFTEAPIYEKSSGRLLTGSYSPLPYAGIRETGGVIRKKSKRLAVPLTKKAKSTGSPLNWKSSKPLIYLYKNSSSGGGYGGVLATIKKKRTKKEPAVFEAQYALRDYVTQRGSGYLSWAAKHSAPEVAKITGDFAVQSFVEAKAPKVK